MAQLLIPGAVQVAIRMECSGQDVLNVIGVSGNFDEDLTVIANKVKTAWEKTGGPLRLKFNGVKMIGYRAVRLDAGGSVADVPSSATGGITTGSLATMASSALVNIGTATRNRSQRGRLYHGPLLETDINPDGRTVQATIVTNITSAYNQFRTDLETGGNPWLVLSRKNLSSSPVQTVSVQSIIATQRRRQR